MLGYSNEELVGMMVSDYVRKVIQAESLWDDFIQKETQSGDIELLHKSGRVVYGNYKAVANVLPGKHLSVITDVTERRKYERDILAKANELSKANQSLKTLFSIISHDLRAPLANLQSLIQLMDKRDLSDHAYKQYFHRIASAISSNEIMLNNLLNWANQQTGGFQINMGQVDLVRRVEDICTLFKPQANAKGIKLSYECSSQNYLYHTDIEVLRLVLRNLISNAIKFCVSGDVIRLRLQENVGFIRVEVIDTGMGISSDQINDIFTTGYTTLGTKNETGTGLGLALCQDFLGLLGSKLEVSSTLGKGTTFYFDLRK